MSAALEPARPARAAEAEHALQGARREIERIDREIVALLGARVAHARAVGAAKRSAGLPVLDPSREAAVVRRAGELARELGVEEEDVRCIFWHVIGLSRRAQLAP